MAMTTRLTQRIGSLERRLGLTTRLCPECGEGARTRFDGEHFRQMRVIFEGDDDTTPDHCSTCGRQLVLRLEFDSPDEVAV
jgi:hypothetical protein